MHVAARTSARHLLFAAVILIVASALWAAGVAPAANAAPPSNTWDLATLQSHLETGSVPGYFLTVLGGPTVADQTPVAIPATIESIVPGETQDGALILFQGTGSDISSIGGIADGMSGSPIYFGDPLHPHPDIDPIIGAVSYGDWFTTDGLGLATPIEYMTAIESNYTMGTLHATPAASAHSARLAKPVTVGSKTIKRVVVAASQAKAGSVPVTVGAAVFAPLDTVQIGGLSSRSKLFKTTAAKLEAAGYHVVAAPAAASVGAYDPAWSTPLVAGASVGTLYSVGDMWIGAAGTVTYVDGDTVMAYGHPLDWLGSTEAYLTNAWVAGIWHTTMEPYKLMAPSAVQGTIVQDRTSGVEGVIGSRPAEKETKVTASATFNGKTVESTSYMPRSITSSITFYDLLWDMLPTYAAQVPIYKAIDAGYLSGSASTSTTVVVNDGTQDYPVTINNLWDDQDDVTYYTTGDLDNMLLTLTENVDGIAPATIKSVDFHVDFSANRNAARIVGAQVRGGLKIGANHITVKLAQYGVKEFKTQDVILTLPKGTELGDDLDVYGAGFWSDYYYGDMFDSGASATVGKGATTDDRQSVADLVQELENTPTNNDILADYQGGDSSDVAGPEGVGSTSWAVNGDVYLNASNTFLYPRRHLIVRGKSTRIMGMIMRVDGDSAISLYANRLGSTARKLVATLKVKMDRNSIGHFSYTAKHLKAPTRYTAVWDGDDDHLGSTGTTMVIVVPKK